MLKKILLIILVLSVSPVFAQKSKKRTKGRLSPEIAIEAAKKAANDAANNPIENTPILNNSSIRGKVFYEDDGKPVRRSSIVLFRKSGGGEEQVLTDENGNFEVSKVAQGIYYPMVNSPGAISLFSYIDFAKVAAQKGEDEIFDDAFKQAQKITVDGKTDLQVDIPVKRGGIVSGKVTYPDGSPATGRPIQVLRKIDGKFQPVVSNFFALFLSSAGTGTYY